MVQTEVQTIEAVNNQVSTPILWDRATTKANVGDIIHAPFTPVMEVVNKDVYADGRVWLLVKPTNASYYTEEWVLEAEEDIQQPAATQPLFEEETKFKQGFEHGQQDAAQRLHPIYTQVTCQYSAGYLEGYNSIRNAQPTKALATPQTWAVRYNDKWEWYTVWVGDRLIGKASTHEKAERVGQKYIANEKARQEHREQVLAAYAG